MKYLVLVLFVLIPLLGESQTSQTRNPDIKIILSTINATGGDLSNEEGSVSYSIGQVFYSSQASGVIINCRPGGNANIGNDEL